MALGTTKSAQAVSTPLAAGTSVSDEVYLARVQGALATCVMPDSSGYCDAGQVWLLDVDPLSWQARACRLAGRNLSQGEWTRPLSDVPYRCTCPDLPPGDGTGLTTCPAR